MSERGIITAGTRVVGKISATGALEIHGHIEGSIDASDDVHIASEARIKSSVHGRRITVSGAVAGDLSASDTLVLEPEARVVGDISAPTIGIRSGAQLRGRVSTGDAKPNRGASSSNARHTASSTPRSATARSATARTASESRATPKTTASTSASAKKTTKKSTKKSTSAKKPPAPVMPKASGRAKKATAKAKRTAPKPNVVAAGRRAKKTSTRRKKAR